MLEEIRNRNARICVVGLGYVGLPTALQFTEKGFNVVGVDKDEKIVDEINRGDCHLTDLNIDERVKKAVDKKKLKATADTTEAIKESDIILITVPTPVTVDKKPDLSHIEEAGRSIAKSLRRGQLVVLESTVYPGVTEETLKPVLEESGLTAGKDFGLAYCPERYNPGDPDHTLEKVARIVGGITPEWCRVTEELYKTIIEERITPVRDIKTAEAAKVIENIQRDLNIALMNELAMIFEKLNIDILEVIDAAKTKWNFNVYYPGAGVGGHCLPVDPYYLVKKAEELGYHSKVITAGRAVNDYMPEHIFKLLVKALNECRKPVNNSRIIVLGFSYKENVGDPRETPVKKLIEKLRGMNAEIIIVDPFIEETYLKRYGKPERDVYAAVNEADAAILMTAHDVFKDMDMMHIKELMKTPVIIDGRRVFNGPLLRKMGFIYKGVGYVNEDTK